MLKRFKNNYFLFISTFLILYFFFNLLSGQRGLISYFEKKKILENLKQENSLIIDQIKDLDFKNSLLSDNLDLDYIETLIRERFIFGKKNSEKNSRDLILFIASSDLPTFLSGRLTPEIVAIFVNEFSCDDKDSSGFTSASVAFDVYILGRLNAKITEKIAKNNVIPIIIFFLFHKIVNISFKSMV